MNKLTNCRLDNNILQYRVMKSAKNGYPKAKWILFCEILLQNGFVLELYEARKTFSKYITVKKINFPSFKVRFSNHAPIPHLEAAGSCDFFVGRTNYAVTTTQHALQAVSKHFKQEMSRHKKEEYEDDFEPIEEALA